jgi:hypothetical protein
VNYSGIHDLPVTEFVHVNYFLLLYFLYIFFIIKSADVKHANINDDYSNAVVLMA